jgi:hypothetical protein
VTCLLSSCKKSTQSVPLNKTLNQPNTHRAIINTGNAHVSSAQSSVWLLVILSPLSGHCFSISTWKDLIKLAIFPALHLKLSQTSKWNNYYTTGICYVIVNVCALWLIPNARYHSPAGVSRCVCCKVAYLTIGQVNPVAACVCPAVVQGAISHLSPI